MCNLCHDTGRMPMKGYKHGFYNCPCKPSPPERFIELNPSDFDFPMSSTFRGASFDYCGNKDPTPYTREVKTETVIIEQKTDLRPIYAQLAWFKTKLLEKVPKKIANKGLYDSVG